MLQQVKKIEFDLYLTVLGILTFLSYIGVFAQFLIPVFLIIAVVMIFLKADVLYVVAIGLFLQMGFAELRDNVEITTYYAVGFLILLIIDSIKNRKFNKLGYLFYPLVALNIASIITIFNAPDMFSWFAGFVQTLITIVLYVYFLNTLSDKKDNIANIGKILMYAGMVVTFEMLHFLHISDLDLTVNISRRLINLGWENLNVIIYSNILSIPFIGYLVLKSKIKLPYMLFALINIVGILLTLSRSSILTLAIVVILIIPIIFFKEDNKKSLVLQGVVFGMIVLGAGLILEQDMVVTEYLDSLLGRDLLKYNDRLVLMERAFEMFKKHPIIGSGGLYTSRVYLEEFGALNYHNTIAQVSSLGILGLGAFVYLFVQKTRLIINKNNPGKWFVLILIYATAFINGSLQPMYFYTSYLIIIFMVIAAIEKSDNSLDIAFDKE